MHSGNILDFPNRFLYSYHDPVYLIFIGLKGHECLLIYDAEFPGVSFFPNNPFSCTPLSKRTLLMMRRFTKRLAACLV